MESAASSSAGKTTSWRPIPTAAVRRTVLFVPYAQFRRDIKEIGVPVDRVVASTERWRTRAAAPEIQLVRYGDCEAAVESIANWRWRRTVRPGPRQSRCPRPSDGRRQRDIGRPGVEYPPAAHLSRRPLHRPPPRWDACRRVVDSPFGHPSHRSLHLGCTPHSVRRRGPPRRSSERPKRRGRGLLRAGAPSRWRHWLDRRRHRRARGNRRDSCAPMQGAAPGIRRGSLAQRMLTSISSPPVRSSARSSRRPLRVGERAMRPWRRETTSASTPTA